MAKPGTSKNPIRVLIVDDHKIIREGLCDLIASQPGMSVVGDAADCAAALDIVSREHPDVVVLDLDLGQESGLELIPELLHVAGGVNIIVLTGVRSTDERDKAMELGAKGVVLKEDGAADLLKAIEKVFYTGEYWLEPGAAQRIFGRTRKRETIDPEASRIAQLTPAERGLINCIGKGMDNHQIAEHMYMAESTVRNSLTKIYAKLEIKGGRLALLVYAHQHGLIKSSLPKEIP
jgi:DNA-binding NarL/FixJ family response regulator